MRNFVVLLAACGICADAAHADTVRLTRDDVGSARDIQLAIYHATHFGTIPGTVIFDGRKGDFALPGGRLNLEIPVSNLTVSGINHAAFTTCTYGVTLSTPRLRNIVLEGMRFDCSASGDLHGGIIAEDASDVTIRNNTFNIDGLGIYVVSGSGWKIRDNVINSSYFDAEPASAVEFVEVTGSEVIGNTLKGNHGVTLSGSAGTSGSISSQNRILDNRIVAQESGIRLWDAVRNAVMLNQITLTASGEVTGILLNSQSSRNLVLWNKASSTTGADVTAVVDQGTANKVSGNKP